VSLIKANTARDMREKFPFLNKVYWGSDGIWSIGYFISTVGVNESVIRRYIEQQGQEDSGQAQLELG
jgi:putative transposase